MATIDKFTAGRAFGLSALLAGVNPKNLALTLAAAMSIAQAGLSGAQPWIALAIFVILASLTSEYVKNSPTSTPLSVLSLIFPQGV